MIKRLDVEALEIKRRDNLRQLLLRASRAVNSQVVRGLHAKGHTSLRPTHTTLLSNLPLAGANVTEAASRAGVSKQAIGRLATELEKAGYLKQVSVKGDARVRLLKLTDAGLELMVDSFGVMTSIEEHIERKIGTAKLEALRFGLQFIAMLEEDRGRSK